MVKFPGYFKEASRTTCAARAAINRLAHNVQAHADARKEAKLGNAAIGERISQTDAALENARDRLMTAILQGTGTFKATWAYMQKARREGRDEPFYLEKLYRNAFRHAEQEPALQRMLQRIAFIEAAREHFGIEDKSANVYFYAAPHFKAANASRIEAAKTDFSTTMNSFFRAAPPRPKQAEADDAKLSRQDHEPPRNDPARMSVSEKLTA